MLRSEFESAFREACKKVGISPKRALRSFYDRLKIIRARGIQTPSIAQVIMESGIPRDDSRKLFRHLDNAIGVDVRVQYVAREM